MSWEKELRNYGPEFGDMIQRKMTEFAMQLSDQESKCFNVAKDDCDKFVQCMLERSKTIDRAEKKLELSLEFAQKKVAECFKKSAGEPLSIEECKAKSKEKVNKAYEDLLKNIA